MPPSVDDDQGGTRITVTCHESDGWNEGVRDVGPIVIDIDPVALHLGHFTVQWYGVGIAAAIAAGFSLSLREAKRKGISQDDVYGLGVWAVIAGIVGARLLHVIDYWSFYLANPLSVFSIQGGGLAIFGAILGGAAAAVVYTWRRRLSVGRMLDTAAPGLILGQAIGRIGCIINGDAVGAPTDLPWGFVYTNAGAMAPTLGDPYLPTQVYEMVLDLAILGFLWWARKRVHVDGLLFLIYLSLYSAAKFTISFWREEAIFLFGLKEAQVVALAAIVFAVVMAVRLLRTARAQGATA